MASSVTFRTPLPSASATIHLRGAVPGRDEREPAAVGAPARRVLRLVTADQLPRRATVGRHPPDIGVAASRRQVGRGPHVDDRAAVGRELRVGDADGRRADRRWSSAGRPARAAPRPTRRVATAAPGATGAGERLIELPPDERPGVGRPGPGNRRENRDQGEDEEDRDRRCLQRAGPACGGPARRRRAPARRRRSSRRRARPPRSASPAAMAPPKSDNAALVIGLSTKYSSSPSSIWRSSRPTKIRQTGHRRAATGAGRSRPPIARQTAISPNRITAQRSQECRRERSDTWGDCSPRIRGPLVRGPRVRRQASMAAGPSRAGPRALSPDRSNAPEPEPANPRAREPRPTARPNFPPPCVSNAPCSKRARSRSTTRRCRRSGTSASRWRPGGILGLLGPNGSGKSTTVSILTGLLEPSGGTVLFDGRPIRDDLLAYKARIGYVPEEAVLYTYLTGPEYLALVGGLRGIPPAAAAARRSTASSRCSACRTTSTRRCRRTRRACGRRS